MRRRRGDHRDEGSPAGEYLPGSLAAKFASSYGWPLSTNNIMVEGELDVQYFELANALYMNKHSKTLLDKSLSLFAVGRREQGGTHNFRGKFELLREILRIDPEDKYGNSFRVVCLLDNDYAGKRLCYELKDAGFVLNKDVFLLHRQMPRSTRDPAQFGKYIREQNSEWSELDCEIEDLLTRELLELFIDEYPNSLQSEPHISGSAHHYDLTTDGKSKLIRFVREYASLRDVQGLVEILQTIRYLLKLDLEA